MKLKNLRLKNIIFIALLVFLFVEVLIIFPSHLEKKEEAEARQEEAIRGLPEHAEGPLLPPTKEVVKAQQRIQGMQVAESKLSKKDWELFSSTAEGSQGKGTWNLKNLRVLFYNNEKVEYTVTGDEGAIDANTKNLKIRGHVVTKSANGYIFETPSIFYNSANRKIESPEDVVMRGPDDSNGQGMILRGSQMVVFVDQSRMLIQGKATAEKVLKDKKKLQIVADHAEFSGKTRQARFLGSVLMNYNKIKIEGPEAMFVYGEHEDVLTNIKVLGGVKVSDVDKFASSETMDLSLLENKLTFRGRPKIIQNDDELTGDEITFLEDGKRVKVEKVKARVDK